MRIKEQFSRLLSSNKPRSQQVLSPCKVHSELRLLVFKNQTLEIELDFVEFNKQRRGPNHQLETCLKFLSFSKQIYFINHKTNSTDVYAK